MEVADGTLFNGIDGNVSDDVATSFVEPAEKRSSAGDEDEKEGGNVSDDRIRVVHLKNLVNEVLLRERSDLQPTLASADFENACADVDRKMKAPVEEDGTLLNAIGGNVSDDLATSFLEPPEKRSSADDEDEKEGGNVSDDRIRVLHPKNLETEVLLPERSDVQPTLASADLENEFADIDRRMKPVVHSKNLEDQMSDLKMANELVTAKFLENECSDLYQILASSPDLADMFVLMHLLRYFSKSLKAEDARPKVGRRMKVRGDKMAHLKTVKEDLNTINEMLKESIEEVEAVIKKTNHKEAMASLDEKLLLLKHKCDEIITKGKPAVDENMVIIFIRLLVIIPEKKEKMMILKKGLMLAMEILKFKDNKVEKELKQLEYRASKLEQRAKKILSGYEDGVSLQNKRRMKKLKKVDKGINFSEIVYGAVAGALIIAFCLRHN